MCLGLSSWRVQGSDPHVELLHIHQADGQNPPQTSFFVLQDKMLHQLYLIFCKRPCLHKVVGATDAALNVTVGGGAQSQDSRARRRAGVTLTLFRMSFQAAQAPLPGKVSQWTACPTRPLKVPRDVPSQRVPGWGLVQAGDGRPLTHRTSARDKGYNGAGRAGGGW